jgi:hypothetical protein
VVWTDAGREDENPPALSAARIRWPSRTSKSAAVSKSGACHAEPRHDGCIVRFSIWQGHAEQLGRGPGSIGGAGWAAVDNMVIM